MFSNPWIAFIVTLMLALFWMQLINLLVRVGLIPVQISRKLVHIGTGPIFVLCWLLFPDASISRFLAALVPLLIVVQLGLTGLGLLHDKSSIQAMSRNNDQKDLLKGPLIYGIVFVIVTIFFWKTPQAIISLMILCGGDGMADLIGTKFGTMRLPWSKQKTVIGTLAMFFFGFFLAFVVLMIYAASLSLNKNIVSLIIPLIVISFTTAIVESITPSDLDNLSVPTTSLILALILI